MTTHMLIGGNRFRINSDTDIRIEASVCPFLCEESDTDIVNIRIIHDVSEAPIPNCPMSGEDLLLEYYMEKDRLLCLSKGGTGGYLSTVVCSLDYSDIVCYLDYDRAASLNSLGSLLRLVPMRTILQKRDTLFLHASQIATKGKGILFTAPSGTGKTTQAKLWKTYRGSQIICNDRTLIRNGQTYGYPVDGSEPVISGETFPLGVVVLLEQSAENKIRQLRPREALLRLMPQMVCDHWNPAAASVATQQILELIREFPVYLLKCTPDERAVICLEQQLEKDGVL